MDPHATVKDANSPALLASEKPIVGSLTRSKCDTICRAIITIVVERQNTTRLVLHQYVAATVTVPVSKMNTNAWPRDIDEDLCIMAPLRWRVDVDIYLSSMTIVIDPDVIIGACSSHVAVEIAISFELSAAAS